jgi:hypothetical protein
MNGRRRLFQAQHVVAGGVAPLRLEVRLGQPGHLLGVKVTVVGIVAHVALERLAQLSIWSAICFARARLSGGAIRRCPRSPAAGRAAAWPASGCRARAFTRAIELLVLVELGVEVVNFSVALLGGGAHGCVGVDGARRG